MTAHSVKCTREEATAFKNKVKNFLAKEKLSYKKIVALRTYGGQVKIFTGNMITRLQINQRRKLVAFKNSDGSYEGDEESIQELKSAGGDSVYIRTSEPMQVKEYYPVFRYDSWNSEKKHMKANLSIKETNLKLTI